VIRTIEALTRQEEEVRFARDSPRGRWIRTLGPRHADHMGCLVHLEHDYHVSFTPEELAKGEVYYNYQMTDGGMEA